MRNLTRTMFFLAVMSFLAAQAGGCAQSAGDVVVVFTAKETEHAAREFAKYAGETLGRTVPCVEGESAGTDKRDAVVLIGSPRTNKLARELEERNVLDFPDELYSTEAFVVRSAKDGKTKYLLLAGGNDVGTLYAVYEYLEKFCDVGFFLDGERVPRRASLPMDGVSLLEKPRFRIRQIVGPIGPDDRDYFPAFDKYRGIFWDFDRWKNWLDWMAKNRFNYTVLNLMPRATGVYDKVYPGQLDYNWWPHDYRNRLFHQIVDYGRKLGIGFWTTFYEDQNNPRIWREMREEFGGGCWYGVTLGETKFAEELVQQLLERIGKVKEIDPQARITVDTWTIPYLGWTKDEASKLFSLLPEDVCLVETQADWGSIYKTYNYYGGREFAFGIIHSFTHWDVLHSRIRQYAADLRQAANDPKAANCTGVSLVPELIVPTWDFLYGYALGRLAWNPNEVTYEGLIQDFVRVRFGRGSVPNMLKSVELLETFNNDIRFKGGIMEGHYLMPLHRMCLSSYSKNPYIDGDVTKQQERKLKEDLRPLRESLALALAEKERLREDGLYLGYLTELARTYITEVATHRVILMHRSYKAATDTFKEGKTESAREYVRRFERESAEVDRTLGLLENLLSTRDDYSLARFIDQVMAVPGTKPGTERNIKEVFWRINGYYRNEVYEVVRDVYRPEVGVLIGELRKRLVLGKGELIDLSGHADGPQGSTILNNSYLQEKYMQVKARFLDNPVSKERTYKGGTIQAVQEAFERLPVPDPSGLL